MKIRIMPSVSVLISAMLLNGVAFAESPMCGEAQDDSWMRVDALQEKVETMGYTIDNLGISEGNCYQVTGLNAQGQNITAYLDPRTGDVVQEDVAQ